MTEGPATIGARNGERGVALVITLMAVALLTILVVQFTYEVQVDHRRAAHWLKARKAAGLAESGLVLAKVLLELDARAGKTDALTEPWALPFPPIEAPGGGLLAIRIDDEQGRYNINRLRSASAGETTRFARLLELAGVDPRLVAPLADWIDADSKVRFGPEGAEAPQYRDTVPPYAPRNAPMLTLRESVLVRGLGPRQLLELAKVAAVLPAGERRININTAPEKVLRALHPRMEDERLIGRLLERRARRAISGRADLESIPGLAEVPIASLVGYSSKYFRVRTVGSIDGIHRSLEALVTRENGKSRTVYRLERDVPTIAGVDTSVPTRLNELSWPDAS